MLMYVLPIALLLCVALPPPDVLLVSIQGPRKIGTRVYSAARKKGLPFGRTAGITAVCAILITAYHNCKVCNPVEPSRIAEL